MRDFVLYLAMLILLLPATAVCGQDGAYSSYYTGSIPPAANEYSVAAEANRGMVVPVQFKTTPVEEATEDSPVRQALAEEPATESKPLAGEEPMRLPARSASAERLGDPTTRGPTGALGTVVSSLAIVIGLFLLVVWVTRRGKPGQARALPSEVVEVLGRAPMTGKQEMQLLRVGSKLVLVCHTADGLQTITEITDAEEVERLSGLCQQSSEGSVTATFRQVFSNLDDQPSRKRRLGREARTLARSREEVFSGESTAWEGGDA